MKIAITIVGQVAKVEVDLGEGGTVEVHESPTASGTKPANPALDLSTPYPVAAHPVSPRTAEAPAPQRVEAQTHPALYPAAPAEPSPTASLTKAELARPWGKSSKRGPRSKSQQAEDAAWEAAGKPATTAALDALGKSYETKPDGTALASSEEVAEQPIQTELALSEDRESARQAKLDADFGPALATSSEDDFGPPVAVAQDIPGVPPGVFEAIETKDIIVPLAQAKLSKAQILSFLEANHQKLKPLAGMPLDRMLARCANALERLKVE